MSGSDGKESDCRAGDPGLIPETGRRNGYSLHCGEFHGQVRLVGHSPWSHKESETTEQLTLSLSVTSGLDFLSAREGYWD